MPLPRLLFTIGHSTHPIEYFLQLLTRHEVAELLDVRSFPGSRRWPQFNQEPLKSSVEAAQIHYQWLRELGGRRHSKTGASPHTAWRIPAFRSYADYADSAEFAAALQVLVEIAVNHRSAIMCSEGLWWRCHRRIISDHMTICGWEVRHIMPDGKLVAHSLPPFASVIGHRIIYDGGPRNLE